ncbi:TonB-dependent receptor plug domain-containing protein [Caldimonas aquatica]|uniref:TonB-dependent receptor n=1 Tax=Caldimonas aquatica TaxID=376175 RepID=A0ABY6MTF7_9BURK|nr:TonB-dependent receptor [Schlegelella aquatica]UZD55259.1 TonB-dependent receptor [Schlegelella aquatica]
MPSPSPPRVCRPAHRATLSALLLAVLHPWASPVLAQSAEDVALSQLGQLMNREVHSASRYAQSSLDAPAVVWVVPREQIVGHAYRTLGEALESVPSAYLTSDRAYDTLGLRGFNRAGDYNTRTLMLLDGQRINDPVYDQGLPGLEFPMVADWIKRVEFVAGPTSSVYGGNALFGTAHVTTIEGRDEPGARISLGAGSDGLRRLVTSYGRPLGATGDFFIGWTSLHAEGATWHLPEHASPAHPQGRAAGLDATRQSALLLKYRAGPWRWSVVSSQRRKHLPNAPYGVSFGTPGTYVDDHYALAALAWDGGPTGRWHPQGRVSFSRYTFSGRYVFAGEPPLVNVDRVTSDWADAELRSTWRGWLNHTLVVGLDLRSVLKAQQHNYDVDPFASHLDDHRRGHRLGLFVQDEYRLSEHWLLTGGVRWDRVDGLGPQWSPRAAVVWRPQADRAFKLLVGRAFRAPNLNERYYDDGASQRANPALRAERIRTVELAMEQNLGPDSHLTATLYRYEMDDLIEMDESDPSVLPQYRNLGQARAEGLELYWQRVTPAHVRWRASAAWQEARSGGQWLSNSPRWLLKAGVLAPFAAGWHGGVEVLAMGARRDRAGERLPGHALVHASVEKAVGQTQSLRLRVRNVGDVRYEDPAPNWLVGPRVPQPGRQVELQWTARF